MCQGWVIIKKEIKNYVNSGIIKKRSSGNQTDNRKERKEILKKDHNIQRLIWFATVLRALLQAHMLRTPIFTTRVAQWIPITRLVRSYPVDSPHDPVWANIKTAHTFGRSYDGPHDPVWQLLTPTL